MAYPPGSHDPNSLAGARDRELISRLVPEEILALADTDFVKEIRVFRYGDETAIQFSGKMIAQDIRNYLIVRSWFRRISFDVLVPGMLNFTTTDPITAINYFMANEQS